MEYFKWVMFLVRSQQFKEEDGFSVFKELAVKWWKWTYRWYSKCHYKVSALQASGDQRKGMSPCLEWSRKCFWRRYLCRVLKTEEESNMNQREKIMFQADRTSWAKVWERETIWQVFSVAGTVSGGEARVQERTSCRALIATLQKLDCILWARVLNHGMTGSDCYFRPIWWFSEGLTRMEQGWRWKNWVIHCFGG